MVQSKATTVAKYIKELPPDRRKIIKAVRDVILKNLPKGFVETMNWGMISYEIPLDRYPDTYNKQPLSYAALAAQKKHTGLYLMTVYSDEKLKKQLLAGYEKAGLKPNLGKSCIRFQSIDQIPLEVIGKIIGATSVESYIKTYEASRRK